MSELRQLLSARSGRFTALPGFRPGRRWSPLSG